MKGRTNEGEEGRHPIFPILPIPVPPSRTYNGRMEWKDMGWMGHLSSLGFLVTQVT